MVDWWSELSLLEQFFYVIGFVSLFTGFILATLTVLGLDGIIAPIESETGRIRRRIHFFSIHTVAAFMLGFGWGGIVCLKVGLHPVVVMLLSLCLGMILMVLMFFLMVSIFGFHSRNRLDLSLAVGSVAEVYSTIPAKRSGSGIIHISLGDESVTASAETNAITSFKPGDKVRIIERTAKARFLVREK